MRLFFILVVAALEATVVGLPLTALTTLGVPWALLFLIVLLGWFSDQVDRRLPPGRERAALLVGAAVGGLLLPSLGLGGVGAALGGLLPGSSDFLAAYTLLLLGLYLFWRGVRIDTGDSGGIGDLFGRGAVVGLVAVIVGAITRTGEPASSPAVLVQIVGLNGLGLLALALAHAQDAAGGRLAGLSWRWLATLMAAVGVVVVVAVLGAGLVGGSGGAAARGLITLVLLPFALVGGALAWLFLTFLAGPLSALIQAILAQLQLIEVPEPPLSSEAQPPAAIDGALTTIQRMAEGTTFLLALIPIVLLVVAILLLRRRQAARPQGDEERESLGLVASLGSDLRDLLGRLRNPFARSLTGLRAALAALSGDDATTRTRRAYVRMLLLLEGRDQTRPPTLTPAEFAPVASEATGDGAGVGAITASYEQARYSPAGAQASDADAAEGALRKLERGQ